MATMVPPRIELSELAERFLLSIVDRIPLAQITELHLFEPMRQGGVETGIAVIAAGAEGAERHTIFTARYRAVLKGTERGKYDAEVVAEADAPLVTVETVVRGVQRRSGDEVPPLRLDAGQLAVALRLPLPERYVAPDEVLDLPIAEPPVAERAVTDGFLPAPLADLPGAEGEDSEWPPHT